MTEAATLIQTRKIAGFPIVLVGVAFCTPLLDFMRGTLAEEGTIDPEDIRLFVTDSSEDAAAHVRDIGLRQFGLTYGPRMKRRWYLGEEPPHGAQAERFSDCWRRQRRRRPLPRAPARRC